MPLVRWISKQEFDELYQKTEHELLELCQDIKNTTGDEFAVEVQEVVSRIGNWFNRETKVDHRYTVLFWAGQGEVQVINLMSGFFGGNSKEEVGAFLIGILCQKRVLGNSFPDHLSEMYSEVELSLRRENGILTDELAAAQAELTLVKTKLEQTDHSNKVLLEVISDGNYKFAKAAIASWPDWKKKSAGIDLAEDLTCSCSVLKECKEQMAEIIKEIEWTQKELGCNAPMCEQCGFVRLCHMNDKTTLK